MLFYETKKEEEEQEACVEASELSVNAFHLSLLSLFYTKIVRYRVHGTLRHERDRQREGTISRFDLYLYTQTNHVCDFITLNYTSMTRCVGIY